jgi:hypothetical protein
MNATQSSSPRKFASKFARYSAVTVGGVAGTMAAFESSEAAMIVTNTLITLVDDPTAAPRAEINFNGGVNAPASQLDAVVDVRVTVLTASLMSAQGLNGGLLAGTVGPGGHGHSFLYPTAFGQASSVSAALTFSGGNADPTPNSFGTLANGSLYGNWGGITTTAGYLGVKFEINGNDHFGWVHVTWDPNTSTATIDQYAYQGVAGASARVPEPSSLVMLGLGALGLARRRRGQ